MKRILLSIACSALALGAVAQPKSEVRAVWLTTNSALDFPSSYNEADQRQELNDILARLQQANFNTIIFQAQVKGDVAWDSSYQPTMRVFTGDGSKNQGYDISRMVIDACHARDMEVHAWIVPYRIGTSSEASKYKNNPRSHIYYQHPEWLFEYNGAYYLDPGLPEVREYLVDVYRELVANYDYDGCSFDYTRYPSTSGWDDSETYANNNPEGLTIEDWRRENINTFIADFYDMAKGLKPNFKVGAAPIGTYKNLPGYGNMTAYGVYQDACQWMQSGHHDLLIPQMYWNETYGFSPNMGTWVDNCDGRQLVVGLAPYKMVDGSNNWATSVVTDQIEKVRAKEGMSGVCFFRTNHVIGSESKVQALYDELQSNYFKYPAHIPPMEYNGVTIPGKPQNLEVQLAMPQGSDYDCYYYLTWDSAEPESDDAPIRYYTVYYAKGDEPFDLDDPTKVVAHKVHGTELEVKMTDSDLRFGVTAFDQGYYESELATTGSSGVGDLAYDKSWELLNQVLTVRCSAGVDRVDIYALTGLPVMTAQGRGTELSMELGRLSHGVYLARVQYSNEAVDVHKIFR